MNHMYLKGYVAIKRMKNFSELKKRKLEKQLVMFRLYYERGNVYVELICTEEPKEIASSYKMIPAPKVTNHKKRIFRAKT